MPLMRMTNSSIIMGNGLTLTMDDAGSTVNGLALLDAQGNPMGMESSVLVVRDGIYDRDLTVEPTSFIDTERDIVTSQGFVLAPGGTSGAERRNGAARIVFDSASQSVRFDLPGSTGDMVLGPQGVSFPKGITNGTTNRKVNQVSVGGFFDRTTGTAPGAKIDVDGGSAHIGGGIFVCLPGTPANSRGDLGFTPSPGNDALHVQISGATVAEASAAGLGADSVKVGAARDATLRTAGGELRVDVGGVADALSVTSNGVRMGAAVGIAPSAGNDALHVQVSGATVAEASAAGLGANSVKVGAARDATLRTAGGELRVDVGGVADALSVTSNGVRMGAAVGIAPSTGNDALHVQVSGATVAEASAAGLGADSVSVGTARDATLRTAGGELRVDVGGTADALAVSGDGVRLIGMDSFPFQIVPVGREIVTFAETIAETSAKGVLGPLFRTPQAWSRMYSFETTLFWDHVDGADPLLCFSADTDVQNAEHFQLERYRVKVGMDTKTSPARLLVFGGQALLNASAPLSEALVSGQTYRVPVSFNAATGDVACSVRRVADGATLASLSAQVGSWEEFTSVYLFAMNDNDVAPAGNRFGVEALTVRAGIPHVAIRYPCLFHPPAGNLPLSELVPGRGEARAVADRKEAGVGIVAQPPDATDFQRWNTWVSSQTFLSAPGTAAYPVLFVADELTAVTDVTAVGNTAPFWAAFTPITSGGAGKMDGTSYGDGQQMYSRSNLSRVLQHLLPDVASYEFAAANGLQVLCLVQMTGTNGGVTSVTRNGYTSGSRAQASLAIGHAVMYLNNAGSDVIHWARSDLTGTAPGTIVGGGLM